MHVVGGRVRTSGNNPPGWQRPCRAKATKAKPKPAPAPWVRLLHATPKTKAKPAPAPEPTPPPSPSTQYTHDLGRLWHKAFDEGWMEDAFMTGWVAAVRARDAWLQAQIEAGEGWIQADLSARDDAFDNWSIQEKNWSIEESDQEKN